MTASPLRIRTGLLYDGTLDPPRPNVVVTIAGGKIESIEPADGAQSDREAAALVPGLVNAHVHLEMNGEPNVLSVYVLRTPTQTTLACVENAQKGLRAGVTTVRDLGATESNAVEVRDAIVQGKFEGPAIIAAGQALCMTGGHGWFVGRETDGPWDARKAVREQFKRGASCIKLIATGGVLTPGAVPGNDQLTEEEMRAAVDEAQGHGMRVAAHAIGTNGIKNAIRAGVTSIEHGHLIDDEGIDLMKERGTTLVPTLNAITAIIESGEEMGIPKFAVDKARAISQTMQDNLRRARRARVRFAGGSDAGTPFNRHEDYAREIELMTTILEMTPREALHAATFISADLLGVDAGRIVPGAPADMVLLDGDLEADTRTLRAPRAVLRAGQIVFERA